jgi:hypothetical protein
VSRVVHFAGDTSNMPWDSKNPLESEMNVSIVPCLTEVNHTCILKTVGGTLQKRNKGLKFS